MEETRVVYKRNSAWWFAFCYLVGTFFLLCYGVLSLAGSLVDLGNVGITGLKEASQQSEAERVLAAQIKKDVTLVSYNVSTEYNQHKIAVSIRNDSSYAVKGVNIEIAYLDQNGLPVHVDNEWISDVDVIYPGDTAHAVKQIQVDPQYQNANMSVRLGHFGVVSDELLQKSEKCAEDG